MGDHAQLLRRDAELRQRVAAALGVDDDPLEAGEEPPPELRFAAVRRGSRSCAVSTSGARWRSSHASSSGQREPLQVDDVGRRRRQPGQPERMLQRLQREPQARAPEEPRRERVEELAPPIAVRRRRRRRSETAT